METIQIISEFEKRISCVYDDYLLTCLRGLDLSYKLDNIKIEPLYSDVTRMNINKKPGNIFYIDMLNDILFCSDELLYCTAHLFLYRPLINNPLRDVYELEGISVYPNNQNRPGKRYSIFADLTGQIAYVYWDRVGNLIASFFPDELPVGKNIYFGKAIDKIPAQFQKNEYYEWLKDFKEKEYTELNDMRIKIVHYVSSDTQFNSKQRENVIRKPEIQKLQKEREQLPDFYKKHIDLTITGFEKTLLFLQEVNALRPSK